MKYFSVHNSDLESVEFLSASNDQIATWLLLLAYCSKQLNAGEIRNAKALPDALWMRHGISRELIHADSPLWFWEGENLILSFYDQHGQEVYEKKVAGGKERARRRYSSTPTSTRPSTPSKSPDADKNREIREEYPPDPQGGMAGEVSRKKKLTPTQKKITKIDANTPLMTRIGGWFGRNPKTLWTVHEADTLAQIKPSEAEVNGMEVFYLAEDDGELFRRHDLITLLNNWQGELDKARGYARKRRGAA